MVLNSCDKKVATIDFNDYPVYTENDLGHSYSPDFTVIKVWAPTASDIAVRIYKEGNGGSPIESHTMSLETAGVWLVRLEGDYIGKYYTVSTKIDGKWLAEVAEPYARAVGANGNRAMIIDLDKTNPEDWAADSRPNQTNYNDIIIYESHIRDLSIHASSGIANKGKYKAFTELGTVNASGQPTGVDHLVELGVTHLHLLPAFDFRSIDETQLELNKYNWGYDPQNYNVPEGSYSSNPADGPVRIKEFKEMVLALHKSGIRVVMDAVYNHTGFTEESNFNQLVPGYYYRQNADGSLSDAAACGNETASERPMVRNFIVQSMEYWAKEYHIDGFRVDLMGIHDIETMNAASAALKKIDPTIFVYGEGWTAGGSPLPDSLRALKANTAELNSIGVFSDEMRDALKGQWNDEKDLGFVSGGLGKTESIKFGIAAAVAHPDIDYAKVNYTNKPWAREPWQTINYVSCHDNHTLWDKLKLANPTADKATLIRMNNLAQTIVFTSQGIPFLHSGAEFLRSKKGVENSYQSPDSINQTNWELKSKNKEVFEYTKSLIQLRKNHPAFRMTDADMLRDNLKFIDTKDEHFVAFSLINNANGDAWKEILVFHNASAVDNNVAIPAGDWTVVLEDHKINESGIRQAKGAKLTIAPISTTILVSLRAE
jgi:pullulanase